ncbi:hypothetical protein [Streptomyces sp. NPDC002133]|uniref:hypothetical protein n=1 Tax=Streptomyces sp. NPDC002133 TaxID=3154409 RepID=UPI00332D479E
MRRSTAASADKAALQAPARSGAEPQDRQLDPVVRALSIPRTNLLIADDVGLGETVEAGPVMRELMLRHRAGTVLIRRPAGLTLQTERVREDLGSAGEVIAAQVERMMLGRRSDRTIADPEITRRSGRLS